MVSEVCTACLYVFVASEIFFLSVSFNCFVFSSVVDPTVSLNAISFRCVVAHLLIIEYHFFLLFLFRNETWSGFFKPEVPTEYTDRIKFLERELESTKQSIERPAKYGVGAAFKEIQRKDYRRKRMFRSEFDD